MMKRDDIFKRSGSLCCKQFAECQTRASVRLRHSNSNFCTDHALKSWAKRVEKTLERTHCMMDGEDFTWAVAMNGDANSQVMAHILSEIVKTRGKGKIVGVMVDFGQLCQESEKTEPFPVVNLVRTTCETLGIELKVVTPNLDLSLIRELVKFAEKRNLSPEASEKKISNYLASYYLDQASKEIGALRIAIGRCMTDEITYSMTNYMEMNATKISAPRPWDLNKDLNGKLKYLPKFFPLLELFEEEISLYAHIKSIGCIKQKNFSEGSFEKILLKHMMDLEIATPGTILRVLRGTFHIFQPVMKAGMNSPTAQISLKEQSGDESPEIIQQEKLEEIHVESGCTSAWHPFGEVVACPKCGFFDSQGFIKPKEMGCLLCFLQAKGKLIGSTRSILTFYPVERCPDENEQKVLLYYPQAAPSKRCKRCGIRGHTIEMCRVVGSKASTAWDKDHPNEIPEPAQRVMKEKETIEKQPQEIVKQ
eukprot:TRINITY_DN693_c0_g1_i2.p1 TRINITY_DN693_c0_g1~~TRINITY_DN693_c0_g1_i2.p1  ORF type:complete len:478 (+),score=108.03 TRINITY_DN693_c0_g1_i2:32-1465(+)